MKRTRVPFVTRYKSAEISHIGGASKIIGAKCLEDYIKFAALKMADIIYHQDQQRQIEVQRKLTEEKADDSVAKGEIQSDVKASSAVGNNKDTSSDEQKS